MSLKQYLTVFIIGLALSTTSCSTDITENEITPGPDAIKLSGISTRNDGINGSNIYLKAFLSGPSNVYFFDTQISFAGGLSSVLKNVVFPGTEPTYPVGGTSIRFFAFSGKSIDDRMVLTAGHGADYDAVLSNYGKGSGDAGVNIAHEPNGTPGNSTDPAEILQFRHVMTQVIVSVEVDQTELPEPVDPDPRSVRFTLDDVVLQGTYPIRAATPDPANESAATVATVTNTQHYTLQLGENYLVPSGINLVGKQLRTLVIDDYTATADDLSKFTIQPFSGRPDLLLLPGYSYNLTLTVRRLQVTGIRLTPIPWQAREINNTDVSYDPNMLALNLGNEYINTGDDAITKVVLHSADNRIYVGEKAENSDSIQFVTLPAANVNRVELFTSKGMLLSSAITTEYQGNTLTLPVSAEGMAPENPSQPYSETNPYMITTTVQFMNINKNTAAHYKQAINVDLQTLNLIGDDRIFNGFGDFTGSYDGNGFYIASLDIVGPGLFHSNTGTLKNIRIFSGTMNVSGEEYAGGICGINRGTIVACTNEAMITNATNIVGGICGLNDTSGNIIACLNTGNILEGRVVGGICGTNNNTSEGAITACILTGMLNHEAENLGGVCGTSLPSANHVLRRCFGLVGCAQRYLGGPEVAVDSPNVGIFDCSALEPDILRNGLHEGETEPQRILTRLNSEIQSTTTWGSEYRYILSPAATGITWPMPVEN